MQIPYFFLYDNILLISLGKWFLVNPDSKFYFDFFLDSISFSFVLLTTSIAIFVYCYAFSYFRLEPHVERLLIFLNMFVISMILLVSSGNVISMFFGWELIGLTSFLLINFWTTRVATLKAAFKAFTFNKFSDASLLFFCIIMYNTVCCTNISVFQEQYINIVNNSIHFLFFEFNIIEFICLLLTIAAFIKSAQIGSHIWLPDSMEAPVPASALIHSATLVSAGIYLILRFNFLYEISAYSYFVLPIVGSITAFYGGLVASYQYDIKRILAYSTISHCGFLVVLCGIGCHEYTILYLYVHGFFKAAAFLCVGNVIRFNLNYQDIRFMGGFYKYLPFECFVLFICFLNLAGIPFTFGFLIKHLLIVAFDFKYSYIYIFVYLNLIFAALTGLFYCSKIFFNVFFDLKRSKKGIYIANQNLPINSRDIFLFSNTTLISNFSIFMLVFVAYVVIFYIFMYYCNVDSLSSNLIFTSNLSTFYNYVNADLNLLFNLGLYNIISILFIIILSFSIVKYIPGTYINYYNFAILFILFSFFYLFFLIL